MKFKYCFIKSVESNSRIIFSIKNQMEEIVVRPISAETRLREQVQESILTMNMKREKAAFKV